MSPAPSLQTYLSRAAIRRAHWRFQGRRGLHLVYLVATLHGGEARAANLGGQAVVGLRVPRFSTGQELFL